MQTLDPILRATLDEISPPRPPAARWNEIAEAARDRSGPPVWRLRTRPAIAAPLALAAAIAVLVLAWPFGTARHGTLLERAAAAIGDGPVLHVVVQSGWGGTQVDLATGERKTIHGTEEYWFDPQRGVRAVSRFAGVVQSEATYSPSRVAYLDKTLAFLATDYRTALSSGTARMLGEATVDGQAAYWIRVDTQFLPEPDGKVNEWAHDVAVSKETLKPVATRETLNGDLNPDGISTIESIESLPAGGGDFSAPASPTEGERIRFERSGALTAVEAAVILGRSMLWAGPQLDGLELARITKDIRSAGYDRTTGVWSNTHTGITLFYGASSDGGIGIPPPADPYVQISESTTLDDGFQRGVRNYSPPEGSLLLFGPQIGVMQSHGLHLALEGSTESLLLAAARALEPYKK